MTVQEQLEKVARYYDFDLNEAKARNPCRSDEEFLELMRARARSGYQIVFEETPAWR